jgi:DNA polymerase-3 subunit alpha
MNKDILGIFTSHYTMGKSTLTLDKPEDISDNKPISIISIAKKHELSSVYLVEDNFSGFIEAYKNFKDVKVSLKFGLKLVICNNILDKTEESFSGESKVVIWMKNSDGYKDLIRIYSKAATDGFYYIPRLDWPTLQKMWSDNLILSIPEYSSFLHNNILKGKECVPNFGDIKPNIFYAKMNLPFDHIIEEYHRNFAVSNNLELIEVHPIRFYSSKQFDSYQTFRCINKRSILSKPNIDHFASKVFSFEEYLKK